MEQKEHTTFNLRLIVVTRQLAKINWLIVIYPTWNGNVSWSKAVMLTSIKGTGAKLGEVM
jgi:hypothetical protein